jgi:hypothetical protein
MYKDKWIILIKSKLTLILNITIEINSWLRINKLYKVSVVIKIKNLKSFQKNRVINNRKWE